MIEPPWLMQRLCLCTAIPLITATVKQSTLLLSTLLSLKWHGTVLLTSKRLPCILASQQKTCCKTRGERWGKHSGRCRQKSKHTKEGLSGKFAPTKILHYAITLYASSYYESKKTIVCCCSQTVVAVRESTLQACSMTVTWCVTGEHLVLLKHFARMFWCSKDSTDLLGLWLMDGSSKHLNCRIWKWPICSQHYKASLMVCEQVYSNALCSLHITSLVWPGRPWGVPFTIHNHCQVTMGINMHHRELCHICPVSFIVKVTAIVTYTLEVNSTQMLLGHCQQLKQLVGISPSFIVWIISLVRFKPAPCTRTHEFLWPCISTGREEKH